MIPRPPRRPLPSLLPADLRRAVAGMDRAVAAVEAGAILTVLPITTSPRPTTKERA